MWYTATSASVTNGSDVVTITNGDDISIVQENSGLVFEDSSPVEVLKAYIDTGGNKVIQLARPWSYSTKSNQPLIAYPTDADFAAATAELRRVIDSMSKAGTTEAQAGTDDDKFMTPLKTKAAIDFNTGNAATRDVGTSAGNVMEVGAFGLGIIDSLLSDYDTANRAGFYLYDSTATPSPGYGSRATINVIDAGGSGFQFAGRAVNNEFSIRSVTASLKEPWVNLYHTGNILGTVSQSGGVPTGAIIESGSNVNGQYVKYADGTLICTGEIPASKFVNTSQLAAAIQGLTIYRSANPATTFPFVFTQPPSLTWDAISNSGASFPTPIWIKGRHLEADNTFMTQLYGLSGWLSGDLDFESLISVNWQAIGRWY